MSELKNYTILPVDQVKEATLWLTTSWRESGKNVYKFNDRLITRLMESYGTPKDILNLSNAGGLKRLPFKSFVLRQLTSGMSAEELKEHPELGSTPLEGSLDALVTVDGDIAYIELFLSDEKNSYHDPLFLYSVRFNTDGIEYKPMITEPFYGLLDRRGHMLSKALHELGDLFLVATLDAILYLSAENADIQYIPQSKSQPRRPGKKPLKYKGYLVGNRTYSARAVREGYQVGKVSSNKHRSNLDNSKSTGKGTAKAPHMRRAHFHLYHRKDGDVLHWLDPMYIHGGDSETTVTHKVN